MWYKFASKYTTSKVKFYEIDVNKFQSLAKTFKVSGQLSQLPTVVLLEDWKQYLKFPTNDERGRQATVINWKERELIKYLDLE